MFYPVFFRLGNKANLQFPNSFSMHSADTHCCVMKSCRTLLLQLLLVMISLVVRVVSIEAMLTEKHDFIECLAYSEQTAVVMTGNFSDGYESGKVSNLYILIGRLLLPT